ncbi:transposase [Corynebacterium phocae]|nr:transposase [Corynebacterium phocae]
MVWTDNSRRVFRNVFTNAVHIADHFYVIQRANLAADQVRRRVQQEKYGHRGRKHDPLFRGRRLPVTAHDRVSAKAQAKLQSILDNGDPNGEVALAHRIKEQLRSFYACDNYDVAQERLQEIIAAAIAETSPEEVQKLGATLLNWSEEILNYPKDKLSNGVTEEQNNTIKRVKRIGYGFRNFHNYRIRVLLTAGKPHWQLLQSVNPK